MDRFSIKCLLLLFLLVPSLTKETYAKEKTKTVVIFFSLNESTPAYQSFLDGFRTTFPEYFREPCNLLIEYLDFERMQDSTELEHIVKIHNQRFEKAQLDLIITMAPGTYELLRKSGLKQLESTPTVRIEFDPGTSSYEYHPVNGNPFDISWQVNGQLGLISKRGEKNRRNMFGLFASGGTTKPGALKLMQKVGDPIQSAYLAENKFNEFFTAEAGMVISGCLRFSGGVGRQYYTFTIKELDQNGINLSKKMRGQIDYFSGTLGLVINLDAVNWVVDANFMTGRDLNKSELRFSTGFMLKF